MTVDPEDMLIFKVREEKGELPAPSNAKTRVSNPSTTASKKKLQAPNKIQNGTILRVSEVGVSEDAYILGLLDVVGELKREIFEALRVREIDLANKFFDNMKHIYDTTRSLRFAEATLQGLRKKQDVARIQIENAGNEILYFDAANSPKQDNH